MVSRDATLSSLTRRSFVGGLCLLVACRDRRIAVLPPVPDAPTGPPGEVLGVRWAETLPWGRIVDVRTMPGDGWEQRFEAAQDRLGGPGVVYFPPGRYPLSRPLAIRDGVILRGAPPREAPKPGAPTSEARLALPTVLEFDGPAVLPQRGAGLALASPASDSRCGAVHVGLELGRIDLSGGHWKRTGSRRLVVGCRVSGAAVLSEHEQDGASSSLFVDRWSAAIAVDVDRDALVVGNVLPPTACHPELDLDNRPGIAVNRHSIGGPGDSELNGSPSTYPFAFRRGLVVEHNYVFATGRTAIAFTGDGTQCRGNVVRFARDVLRQTLDGRRPASGAQSNDIRGVEARGWNWRIAENDFEIHSNLVPGGASTNDGHAIFHGDHVDSDVRGVEIRNNISNAPFTLLRTGGVRGCLIAGNELRIEHRAKRAPTWAVLVVADRLRSRHVCRDVEVLSNRLDAGIWIAGDPASGNRVVDNSNIGPATEPILDEAHLELSRNRGLARTERPEIGMAP